MVIKQCSGKTKNHIRCKNKITQSSLCYLHKKQIGGSKDLFNKWLIKEINRIYKFSKKYNYVSYYEPSVFVKGSNIVIGSFEEDEDPDQYFITSGKYPNKLDVKHVRIKESTIEKHIKKKYKNYKRNKSLDRIVGNVGLCI